MKVISTMLYNSSDVDKNRIIKKPYFYLLILFWETFTKYFPRRHMQAFGVWSEQWKVYNIRTKCGLDLDKKNNFITLNKLSTEVLIGGLSVDRSNCVLSSQIWYQYKRNTLE